MAAPARAGRSSLRPGAESEPLGRSCWVRKERAAASWTNSRFLLSQLNSLQLLCHISRDNSTRLR